VIDLEAATVLLQWAVGGLAFLWVTTRRRQVGLGYGWLLRGIYAAMAAGAAVAGLAFDPTPVRDAASSLVAVSALAVLAVSVSRRKAGVRAQQVDHDRRSARVAAMTGVDRADRAEPPHGPEFDPRLDLVPVVIGVVGLVAAGLTAGGPTGLALARTLVGAAFLGSISDAMLLGHWYLVQPGLPRAPLLELVRWVGWIWPFEVGLLLWPPGMVAVLRGSIDDGYDGLLGWFWVASAAATIVLVQVTKAALRERYYSAVMAATGLLYLAILTAFCTDLVARAVLAG
jgi:hypothetical protein